MSAGAALIGKLQSAIVDVAALEAAIAGVIDYPKHNQVLQKVANAATFKVTWRGSGTGVRLKQGSTIIAESATGEFTNVPLGWYQAVLVNGTVEGDSINVGVGDVYVVAGQSNAVSPNQPADYVPARPTAPGKVVISDYYKQGMHSFVDAFDCSFTSPFGGVAWIACGIALNRAYPVMFVNVARGNTSTDEWVNIYVSRIFDAWAIYHPRAILWHQGESDAALHFTQAQSYSNLNACVESLRQVTVTPWVMALNSTNGGYPPIRAAQQQVIDQWSHVHQGPDTDAIRSGTDPEFWGNSMQAHGQLWAASLAALGL
jgi:hypothetical protein